MLSNIKNLLKDTDYKQIINITYKKYEKSIKVLEANYDSSKKLDLIKYLKLVDMKNNISLKLVKHLNCCSSDNIDLSQIHEIFFTITFIDKENLDECDKFHFNFNISLKLFDYFNNPDLDDIYEGYFYISIDKNQNINECFGIVFYIYPSHPFDRHPDHLDCYSESDYSVIDFFKMFFNIPSNFNVNEDIYITYYNLLELYPKDITKLIKSDEDDID